MKQIYTRIDHLRFVIGNKRTFQTFLVFGQSVFIIDNFGNFAVQCTKYTTRATKGEVCVM